MIRSGLSSVPKKNPSRWVAKYREYVMCTSDGKCHGLSKPSGDWTGAYLLGPILKTGPLGTAGPFGLFFFPSGYLPFCIYFYLVAFFRHVPLSFKHFFGNICWLRFVAPDCLLKFAIIRVPSKAHKPYSAYLYTLRTYRFFKRGAFVWSSHAISCLNPMNNQNR